MFCSGFGGGGRRRDEKFDSDETTESPGGLIEISFKTIDFLLCSRNKNGRTFQST